MRLNRNIFLSMATGSAMVVATAVAQMPLPEGHPPIEQVASQLPATTQPVNLGTLTIQAVQSTANAAPVTSGQAVVDVFSQGQLVKSYDLTLDVSGKAILNDLPVSFEITPAVKVVHQGVEYAAEGHLMDSTHPNQQIDVPVYDSTTESPAWNIKMRHLMVEPAANGLQVMDVVQIDNPTDRAWTGIASDNGKGTTFVLPLPAGASEVQLIEGFHDCCSVIDEAGVHNQMALLPGTTLYRLAYLLPVESGQAEISVASPAPTDHLMVFVPNDGSKVQTEGVEPTQSAMGDGSTRFYKASNVERDSTVKVSLSGVAASASTQSAHGAPADLSANTLAKAIAGAGSILILLLGGAFMFLRGPKTRNG